MHVLVIPISTPLKVGVYDENHNLIESVEEEGKTSDVLPLIFKNILKKYDIRSLYYVNGPGSFMSIKVSYIFLKSISVVKNIPFYSCKGFEFNENSPIKALGKKYFFNNNDGNISIDFLKEDEKVKEFQLPKTLDIKIFSTQSLPSYNLPAVN